MSQLEIWTIPGFPLKEEDWKNEGFISLQDYIESEINGHVNHQLVGCPICLKNSTEPLVSFGVLHPNGDKEVKLVCNKIDDLPTEDIDGVLIFN